MKTSMIGRRWQLLTMGASTLALTTAMALPALAQAEAPSAKPDTSGQLEEIVVTARFKKEDVQQTPIAITAMTGDQMEARGYNSAMDVAKTAPNVTIEPGNNDYGKTAQVTIRGIGQTDFNFAESPGIGFYIDGVYFDSVFGSEFDLLDLDHIEVLRGPQGTLFGKNNEGGAIRIFTQEPKGDNSGYVQAGYGSYNREYFKGAFDVTAIPDKVFVRVSGASNTSDGYMNILDYACLHPGKSGNLKPQTTSANCVTGTLGGEDVQDGRIKVRILPVDGLEINLDAHIHDDRGESGADKELGLYQGQGPALGVPGLNPSLGFSGILLGTYNQLSVLPQYKVAIDRRFLTTSPYTTYGNFSDPAIGLQAPNASTDLDYGFSSVIDWDALPGIHVKSITGYETYSGNFSEDQDGSPLSVETLYNTVQHRQTSEELQVSGTVEVPLLGGMPLDWTVGGYYLDSWSQNGGYVDISVLGLAFNQRDPSTDDDYSGFLHGVLHITDKLSFEMGYRYSYEDRSYTFYREVYANDGFLGIAMPGCPESEAVAKGKAAPVWNSSSLCKPGTPLFGPQVGLQYTPPSVDFSRSDAKAGLNYEIEPGLSAYADVSTGYKAGGFNPRPFDIGQITEFGPEDLTAYELGAKTEFFDHKLRFNTAAFVSDYKDLQVNTLGVDPTTGLTFYGVENAGHVLLEGLEGEVDATPMPGMLLNGSVGYILQNQLNLGSYAKTPVASGGPILASDPKIPGVPTWKISLGGQYTQELGDFGSLTGRLDWIYQSTVFFDTANTALFAQPGYGVLNSHVTWDSADGAWEGQFEVANVTDQLYYLNKFQLVNGSVGTVEGQPGLPRTYMFTMKRFFAPQTAPVAYTPPPAPAPVEAPAAAPVAAPEAQRSFQVFFDFDKSDITDAASRVIQAASDAVKAGNIVQITVTGHTDTVGAAKYNQALSERRAAAVKSQLVTDGVPGGEIAARGVGKTGLLVPTADGVREPQNRRAEIVLQ